MLKQILELYHNTNVIIENNNNILDKNAIIFNPRITANYILFKNTISDIGFYIKEDTDKRYEINVVYDENFISLQFQLFPVDFEIEKPSNKYSDLISYQISASQRAKFEKFHIQYNYKNDTLEVNSYYVKGINSVDGNVYPANSTRNKILLFENQAIYTWLSKRERYIPLSLKQLQFLYNYKLPLLNMCITGLLCSLKKQNPLFLDIIKDLNNDAADCPIAINEITTAKWTDKQHLFSSRYHFDFDVPKTVNKMSFKEAYIKLTCAKYIKSNDRQLIYAYQTDNWPRLNKEVTIETLHQYFIQRGLLYNNLTLSNKTYFPDSCDRDTLLYNYINMAIKVNKTVDLHIDTFNNLLKKHDNLIVPYVVNEKGHLKIPENSPFFKLQLPDEFEKITTKKRLIEETMRNKNCVFSYMSSINQGKCVIYSIEFDSHNYTIEICYSKKKGYYCNQCRGYRNCPAPILLLKKIDKALNMVNTKNNQ